VLREHVLREIEEHGDEHVSVFGDKRYQAT
jgi:hypothetical protein